MREKERAESQHEARCLNQKATKIEAKKLFLFVEFVWLMFSRKVEKREGKVKMSIGICEN